MFYFIVTIKKYELERQLIAINKNLDYLSQNIDEKKEILGKLRIAAGEATKDKQRIKLESSANNAEQDLAKIVAKMHQMEMQINKLRMERDEKMIYPVCTGCKQKGNIFVFQAVGIEETLNEFELSENIPKTGTGIIYCIKCGYIVGTASRK